MRNPLIWVFLAVVALLVMQQAHRWYRRWRLSRPSSDRRRGAPRVVLHLRECAREKLEEKPFRLDANHPSDSDDEVLDQLDRETYLKEL